MSAKPWVIQPLRLPVGDKVYEVQPIGYDDGLSLLNVGKNDSTIKKNSPDKDLFKLVLGDVWDTMLADTQPYPAMFRAGTAALHYQTALVSGLSSEDSIAVGEAVWESGLSPEAVAAALTAANQTPPQKKPPQKKPSTTSRRSTSTGAASGTPRPASTSGTRSRTGTRRTTPAKKAATRSAGKRSPRPSSGR